MWRVYGSSRWSARAIVRRLGLEHRNQEDHDNRRTLGDVESRAATGVGGRAGSSMRLLSIGTVDVCRRITRKKTETN
jgi:hypothetical protein